MSSGSKFTRAARARYGLSERGKLRVQRYFGLGRRERMKERREGMVFTKIDPKLGWLLGLSVGLAIGLAVVAYYIWLA